MASFLMKMDFKEIAFGMQGQPASHFLIHNHSKVVSLRSSSKCLLIKKFCCLRVIGIEDLSDFEGDQNHIFALQLQLDFSKTLKA